MPLDKEMAAYQCVGRGSSYRRSPQREAATTCEHMGRCMDSGRLFCSDWAYKGRL